MKNGPRNCPIPTAKVGPTMATILRPGVTPATSQKRRSEAEEVETAIP